MENKTFKTTGVCSKEITFDFHNGCIHNVSFKGGCQGNLNAISKLIEGKSLEEVKSLLEGNTCGPRPTSCGDQLAKAIAEVL